MVRTGIATFQRDGWKEESRLKIADLDQEILKRKGAMHSLLTLSLSSSDVNRLSSSRQAVTEEIHDLGRLCLVGLCWRLDLNHAIATRKSIQPEFLLLLHD